MGGMCYTRILYVRANMWVIRDSFLKGIFMANQKDKKREEDILNAGIAGAAYETVQRYGYAAKEHYVAYSGVDNEIEKTLKKGLKDISEERINPKYKNQNIRQQAGFSAEVKTVARDNAENIINKNPNRRIRTDDMGSVNDPLSDLVTLDVNGDIIKGSETQLKFLGASDKDPAGKGDAARALPPGIPSARCRCAGRAG